MQISKRLSGAIVELLVEGRMDVYWAEHLAAAVQDEIRQGSHHIRLDLSRVPYLSSAGIGVLVKLHRELRSIQGSFAVTNCSRTVLKSLEITNLESLLVEKQTAGAEAGQAAGESRVTEPPSERAAKRLEANGAVYEVYPLEPGAKLECRKIGDASPLERSGFRNSNCHAVQFSEGTFAIGLGALGDAFEDCEQRFGELIAAGGAIAYLPTDGTNAPDFLLGGGTTMPEAQVCYGVACEGASAQPFQSLIRFEATRSDMPITVSELLETCLELADSQQVGVVIVAEAAGLIGASLRRSPVTSNGTADVFAFPEIRQWLSYTAERAYTRSVVLLAGVAARGEIEGLKEWLRPLGNSSHAQPPLTGHLHAAAFSYRPVPKGKIELKESVRGLFEGQTLEGILHLLHDDRDGGPGRQSELLRGACWIAPIGTIRRAGTNEARG